MRLAEVVLQIGVAPELFISLEDSADAKAAALAEDELEGQFCDIVRPDALTFDKAIQRTATTTRKAVSSSIFRTCLPVSPDSCC